MADDRLFGIDVSQYQGVLDWDAIANHSPLVEFVGIRAGISWGYTDKWFSKNWAEAKRVGIIHTAYHVFYPADSPERQVDNFKKTVGDDIGEFPVTADIELNHGLTPKQYSINLKRYLDLLEAAFGRKPIIYSRATFIDPFVGVDFTKPYGNLYLWWMAHYQKAGVEMTDPPNIPKNVDRGNVIIHQNGDKFKAIGGPSSSMDFNRWLKTTKEFNNLARVETDTEPPLGEEEKIILGMESELDNIIESIMSFKSSVEALKSL